MIILYKLTWIEFEMILVIDRVLIMVVGSPTRDYNINSMGKWRID